MDWESMSYKERAEKTVNDIKLRQERRRIGKFEADCICLIKFIRLKRLEIRLGVNNIEEVGKALNECFFYAKMV